MSLLQKFVFTALILCHGICQSAESLTPPSNARAFKLGGVDLVLPWPEGFMDVAVAEPALLQQPDNSPDATKFRALAQYMSADLLTASPEEAADGAAMNLFVVQVPRVAEAATLTQADFDDIRQLAAKKVADANVFANDPRHVTGLRQLERRMSKQAGSLIQLKVLVPPRTVLDAQQSNLVQITAISRLSVSENRHTEAVDVVTSTGLVLVKGKLLMLQRIRFGATESERDAARKELHAWAMQVLAHN